MRSFKDYLVAKYNTLREIEEIIDAMKNHIGSQLNTIESIEAEAKKVK